MWNNQPPRRTIRGVWHRLLRAIDRWVLWPGCRRDARDLAGARVLFAHHAMHDPAYGAMSTAELMAYTERLPAA